MPSSDALLNEVMPRFDRTRVERLSAPLPAGALYRQLRRHDFLQVHSPLMDAAFAVRDLPNRLRGRTASPPPTSGMTMAALFDEPPNLALDDTMGPWLGLAEDPGTALVFGIVGRFWTPNIEWLRVPEEAFPSFAEPGWGSIAASLSVVPTGPSSSVLTYEARTRCHDDRSRRAFLRYWRLVAPFVGHIERALLLAVVEAASSVLRP